MIIKTIFQNLGIVNYRKKVENILIEFSTTEHFSRLLIPHYKEGEIYLIRIMTGDIISKFNSYKELHDFLLYYGVKHFINND